MSRPEVVGMVQTVLFKIYIYLKEKFDPSYPITQEENLCYQICLYLIDSPDSELFMSPISQKRFIKNIDKDISIIIDHRQISLISQNYSYNLFFEDDTMYGKISKKFDNVLESKRQELETELKSQIISSLTNTLEKIS